MPLPTPFTFSQSSLQDYMDCPRRFQLRYIDRLAWPAVESEPALENERRQQDGQFFHRLVQQYFIGLPAEKISRLANTAELSKWWGNFQQSLPSLIGGKDQTDQSHWTELTLSTAIGAHRLLAKYDLLVVRAGKAIIFDWKTYHKRTRNEFLAARMQTRVYRHLLATAGSHLNNGAPFQPEQIEMIYWFAEFPNEPARFPYDAAQSKRDKDSLEKIIAEIQTATDFPLTADDAPCRFCAYRSYCKRDVAAGDWKDAEDEGVFTINFEDVDEIAF
jgi:CRISPR/Cas system-associated exonuclease Cas4 (RecB family)